MENIRGWVISEYDGPQMLSQNGPNQIFMWENKEKRGLQDHKYIKFGEIYLMHPEEEVLRKKNKCKSVGQVGNMLGSEKIDVWLQEENVEWGI